jgi:DNA-binding MarR family transcriptional regulator
MSHAMSHAHLYFDFLLRCEHKQTLIDRTSAHISSKLMALFVVLATKHAEGQAMTVSGTMALQHLASSAALHQRIDDLREAGMICVVYKGDDRRTKYLVPTDKGDRYLKLMGDLLRARV